MAFLNPLFLLGAFAAVVPVLVHLVRRTRARKLEFPSLMFLRRIEQKTIRRRQLRNLALLAMRCAALLLLALAFARPYFTSADSNPSGAPNPSSVILIDGSYSMQYPGVFDRARQAAHRALGEASPDEQVAVVLFSSSCDVLKPLRAGVGEARAAIDQAQPGLGVTDYLQALQAADAMLTESAGGRRKVYLISDFQDSGWNRTAPPFRLSGNTELSIIDVSDPNPANLAVMEVRSEPTVYSQKYTGKVAARIARFGGAQEGDAEAIVELKMNDLVIERRQITLGPNLSQTVEFSGFNVPEGSNRAVVEVSGDSFPLDNRFHFTVRRDAQINVLAIETASRGRSDSFFIQQSLLAGDTNPYALTVKTAGTVDPAELGNYRALILNDVAGVTESMAGAIKSYVERGGGLILAAGKNTRAGDFNGRFEQISPAELGEPVVARSGYALMSQVRHDHPIFSAFAKGGRLVSTRVYGYNRATPIERASVICALDDGSPVIIEALTGQGKVLLVTTSLDTSWNELPVSPVFLPLLHQMLEYLAGGGSASNYLVGQTFTVSPDADGSSPPVDGPNGRRLAEVRETETGELAVNATEVGPYRLRYGAGHQHVAVNLDTRDSDLSKLDIGVLRAGVSPNPDSRAAKAADTGPLTAQEIEARQSVWLVLLALSLALFIAESIIAKRIRVPKLIQWSP